MSEEIEKQLKSIDSSLGCLVVSFWVFFIIALIVCYKHFV